ncbi:MAG: hypothetical protein KC486_22945 [Myxococcales bacterium]|nr:hypothetical protein [Myxococcales bacterium]MCB1281399.1 hypothetical protein [Salinibacterium sp.]
MRAVPSTVLAAAIGLWIAACGGTKPADEAKPEAADTPESADPEAKTTAPPAAGDGESFAKPTAKPPPPPVGAYLQEKPALFIQRCTAEHPCPKMLAAEGEAHCREYSLGAYTEGWRLPTLDEAKRFAGIDALEDKEGFHWTKSADPENDSMAWIYDPVGGQMTTIPRDRKPFTIRCVYEP